MNHNQGAIQHKYSIAKHFITNRYHGPDFYNHFQTQSGIPYIECAPVSIDLRVLPSFKTHEKNSYCNI